jgi:transcription antitermination factor NusG
MTAQPDGFEPGDKVRPKSGDFIEHVGEVVEVRPGIVIVEYEVFGRGVPVEHRPGDLFKVVS